MYTLIQLRYSHTISTLILQRLFLLFLNIFCVFRIPWRSQAHPGEKSMAINTDLVQDPIETANHWFTNGCWTNRYTENGLFHHSQMRRMYICMDYLPTWFRWKNGHGIVTIIYHKKSTSHVGAYTSLVDPMSIVCSLHSLTWNLMAIHLLVVGYQSLMINQFIY